MVSLNDSAVQSSGTRSSADHDSWGQDPVERDSSIDLTQYWRLLLKHRVVIASIFVVSIVLGAGLTLLMTPKYSASSTLQIDREAARILEADDVAPSEAMAQGEEFFQTQYGLLRSRSLAERVVENLRLDTSDSFITSMGATPPRSINGAPVTAAQRREVVLGLIEDGLSIRPVRSSRLVTVSFLSPDPALSAQVANAFATNFIQSNLDRKFDSSSYARDFLEERLVQTKARLEDAERQLVAYAANQQIINVAEPGANGEGATQSLATTDLVALNESLAAAKARRVAAEEKWRQASTSSLLSMPEVVQNQSIQYLTQARAALAASYEQRLSLYRPDFPEMVQLKAQLDETDRQIEIIAANVRGSVRQEYQVAANEERALQARVNQLKGEVLDFRERSVQYNILQREVDTSRSLYDTLLQRYGEIGVAGGLTSNNISIVDSAQPPTRPSEPILLLNIILAALLGLGLGVLTAFLLEALDETIAGPDDVESKLGLPVLGVIPALAKGILPINALQDMRSGFAEAYYSLRTALQFSTPDGVPSSLFITSSRPSEGKSTTALATAQNFARIGKRVLLLDLDLRKPSMHRLVNVSNDRGMSSILSGASSLTEVVHKVPNSGDLSFVCAGPLPPNPAELLSGVRIQNFLEEARQGYDIIIIDGPPVLGFADAPVLASSVGGTVFVLEARSTRRGQARGAVRRLRIGSARLLGVVLTKHDAKAAAYGGYDYAADYLYGADEPPKKGR